MSKIRHLLLAIVAIVAFAIPAQAQFAWGIKAGINVNSVKFNDLGANFDKENRTGFTGGLTCQFTVPIIGLGFDASLMYVHRVNAMSGTSSDVNMDHLVESQDFKKQDYLEIPIHLRYKIGLPIVGHFVAPYIFTGPNLAFLCSGKAATEAYKTKSFDCAWDLGLGVQLLKHLEIGASYGFGMTKMAESVGVNPVDIGKRNSWTITAAYLF